MDKLICIDKAEDILPEHRNTPIGRLLEYHNLGRSYENYTVAQLFIGM